MKHMILTLLCLQIFMTTKAQEPQAYRPMLVVGRAWNARWVIPSGNIDLELKYYVQGDTVIDGEQYWKLHSDIGGKYQGLALLLERDGKVWWHHVYYKQGKLVYANELFYDFTLNVGDVPDVPNGSDLIVTSVDTVKSSGGLFRRLTLTRTLDSGYKRNFIWVEGIGTDQGPFSQIEEVGVVGDLKTPLETCYDGDECIFTADDFYAPAWTGDQTDVQSYHVGHPASSPLFDLQGRRLPSGQALPSRHGVFIRDGKKILR